MEDYYQKDVPILLRLSECKELLKEMSAEDSLDVIYNSKLVYNQREAEKLKLFIYYKPADYLFEKLDFLRKSGINILELISETVSGQAWVHPEFFDFSISSLIEIRETHHFEHEKKQLVLIIDNLYLFENGWYARDARFKLNENVFPHLDNYIHYGQLGNYELGDRFIQNTVNRETKFGPVEFVLSFNHYYKYSGTIRDILITRDAYLNLRDSTENLKDMELLAFGEDLCLLMSLYWEKNIDFFNAILRVNDKEHYRNREVFRLCNENFDPSTEYDLRDQFATFYDFVQSLSFEKFQIYKGLVHQSVTRFVKVKYLDDISAFMILYNIVEQFRNHFLINSLEGETFTIKEEFNFTRSKRKTDDFIKGKIKEIGEIVADTDMDEFDAKASQKVNFIKKTGLKDQFESFVKYLDLNPADYVLPFENLINVRNVIYHGNIPDADIPLCNKELKKLVLNIILRITAI